MSQTLFPYHHRLRSVERYIGTIGRVYVYAAIVMSLLIGATHFTVTTALERHELHHHISFLTSSQFVRFQQLANHTRALMRASADPNLPEFIVTPMLDEVTQAVEDVRAMSEELDGLYRDLDQNYLQRLDGNDDVTVHKRADLDRRLSEFLARAEQLVRATNEERSRRYTFWGAIDFAIASDSALIRLFSDLIADAHASSSSTINNAKLISTALLGLLAASVVLASLFLFGPLLKKLAREQRRTTDFKMRLEKLAHTDSLTDLDNRSTFNRALSALFGEFEQRGTTFGLLLVDLDHFKTVNDRYGHLAGDAALRHVADAMRRVLRGGDLAARLGGDEFAVLLPGLAGAAELETIARRLSEAILGELTFEGRTLWVSASIGGAIIPPHASDKADLTRIADMALYTAKRDRGTVVVFNEKSLAEQLERTQLRNALGTAAERDEFVVHYQPKVDLMSGRHLGFEALVRWQHPELGLLGPGQFLPLIEESRLIRDMTRAVVNAAGRDLKAWKACGLAPEAIAINLPEMLLVDDGGYEIFSDVIAEHGLEWSDFGVEITENVFLNRNTDKIIDMVTRFREHGLSVSFDDFGTGFASLVHLRDFPFDELKIDRSFVAGIGEDTRSEQIIRAVADLARNLGKRCIAEGIETEEHRRFLLKTGCRTGQGYFFAKPLPADIASKWLSQPSRVATLRRERRTA
ncbi:putative bifunctional diguanylate cyclase/phosphodiesterase [Pelagibacterium halotolerans]|uniref:putative bifunctional diguanylate cyclase/phosphodiesterase n=1 Tax=Pelagibacterium halotolerans TaxID=531813 RepID=UPI00384BACEF